MMNRYLAATAFVANRLFSGRLRLGSIDNPCSTCELFPPINNTQVFEHGYIKAEVNAHVGSAIGDVKVSGTAVGNNLSVDAGAGTVGVVNNVQKFAGYGDMLSSTVRCHRHHQ